MALELTAVGDIVFLVARLLFGGVLAFMGLNHFMDTDAMAGYAESKGVPAPRLSVLASGGTLIFGGLLVALGLFPAIGAGALAAFFLVATPKMHDFWTVDDPQAQQNEMTHFLKNAVLLAASLALLALGGQAWPYAVGL
ncbi:DoxX family protein [Halostella sp. JP-L12]|uniref:DoxX family protein n=1 Tax=Halostella TaxID=1843185 RepID=UPI000EF7A5D8|nr:MULTISPECIES: DoxX family protein [Halostella]NHN49048.1 DoxX family protein [Halostella sp. JP-L12]